MDSKQRSDQLFQELHSTVVKEEPPEEEAEYSSFCYETVTKEEVIIDDQQEHADEQPHPPEISAEIVFKCSECNKSFDHVYKLNKCLKKHNAIRLGLFKCKVCGKCFGLKRNVDRHEATHKEEKGQSVYAIEKDRNGLFKCAECDRTHKVRKMAVNCTKRHMARRLGLYQCKLCNLRVATVQELQRHELRHKTSKKLLKNPKPEAAYEDPSKKVKKVYCKICGKGLSNEVSLKRHELLIHKKGKSSENQALKEVPEPPAKICSKEELQTDEKSETVTKEELIIQDEELDVSAEDEQEEDSRCSLGESQPTEDEAESQQEDDSCESLSATKQKRCNVCKMTFENRYALQMHSKTHSRIAVKTLYEELLVQEKDSTNYLCLFCEKPYSSRSKTAIVHVRRHIHIIDGVYQCKNCGLRCATYHEYQNHVKIHNKFSYYQRALPIMIEGVYTDYESSSEGACEKSDLPMHCKTCNVFFNNTANLNVHLWKSQLRIVRTKIDATAAKEQSATVNKQAVPAPEALVIEGKSSSVIRYDRSKIHKDKSGFYSCSKCDYKTKKKQLYRNHNHGHTVRELGLFTCELCQMPFTNKRCLNEHKATHGEKNNYKCQTCDEKFTSRAEYFRHRLVHTKNVLSKQFLEKVTEDEKGVFTCTICTKTYETRTAAFHHFRIHAVDKFVCDICQKRCPSNSSLKSHKESHGKLRFTCHTCNEKFNSRADIARHRQKHISNVRVFLGIDDIFHCTRCDETFETRRIGLKHFRSHLPAKKHRGTKGVPGNSGSILEN